MSCGHPECTEPVFATGLCRAHYNAAYDARQREHQCSIEECGRPLYRKDWCSAHYQRWRKYGDPLGGGPSRRVRGSGDAQWAAEQRRRGYEPTAEDEQYVAILRADPCAYCGRPPGSDTEPEHIIPVRNGGTGNWGNLTASCPHCNRSKATRDLLGFLLDQLVG